MPRIFAVLMGFMASILLLSACSQDSGVPGEGPADSGTAAAGETVVLNVPGMT